MHTACLRLVADAMAPKVYDPAERAREKAASRAEDARAIASGEKSSLAVRRDNASFAFPDARIRFPAHER